ncbi:hypothetical protein A3A95_03150 [Candidatus Nomurabacteria bacterium RIFCSPLOWO2_01_FULL_39_18]|uniref:YggU family protein n=1 Tax=Candidatus Nomurabacteria bacterium RIFCSPHIGHO2_01_FULL_40_24b TaxID=1801739 RepID=A0A1F6V6Y7_9BACT|nr:MAG: hypothetical protein A2647_03410 [Candidatus Nomurabacteria bacterium RIFCSPHIGHO2_01_FULL_40_24b]OGI89652.1 MAG: hypothetical protein A3A95_03150 [Candidatus Nomurabacteria bacterium RIFCSPLOWO2_01_FULL_39_18]
MRYIHVKVTAGAGKESFAKKSDDHFELSVKEKAERNMANTRVLELVAKYFKVSISKVRIVNGHHHPSKLLVVGD